MAIGRPEPLAEWAFWLSAGSRADRGAIFGRAGVEGLPLLAPHLVGGGELVEQLPGDVVQHSVALGVGDPPVGLVGRPVVVPVHRRDGGRPIAPPQPTSYRLAVPGRAWP